VLFEFPSRVATFHVIVSWYSEIT